jgi:hypothetical protein
LLRFKRKPAFLPRPRNLSFGFGRTELHYITSDRKVFVIVSG